MFGSKKHKNKQGRVAGHMAARPGAVGGGAGGGAHSADASRTAGGSQATAASRAAGGSRSAKGVGAYAAGGAGAHAAGLHSAKGAGRGSRSAKSAVGGSHSAASAGHGSHSATSTRKKPQLSGRASAVLSVLLVLAGVAALAYPFVSNWLASQNHMEAIASYSSASNDTTEAQRQAMLAAAEEYNESLAGDPVHDPFVAGSGYAIPDNYDEVLNVDGEGTMGYLEIPTIGVSLPIYHGTSDEVLAKGVGHISNTSLPIGGEGRHSVLTGHRGLPSAELFTRLDELKEGDLVLVTILGETHAYRVYGTDVVEPDDLSTLVAEPGRDLLTLVTCTPYAVNTHRLLVHCERTEYTPAEAEQQAEEGSGGVNIDTLARIAGVVVGAVVLVVLWRVMRRRERAAAGAAGAGAAGAGAARHAAGAAGAGAAGAGGRALPSPMPMNSDVANQAVGMQPVDTGGRRKRGGSHFNAASKRTKRTKGGGKHAR